MNSLSWLIYFAGALGSLSNYIFFLAISFIFGSGAAIGISALAMAESDLTYEGWRAFIRIPIRLIIIGFLLGFVICIIPSKETVYLIAGSEVGAQLIQSKQVSGVVDSSLELVKAKIDKELQNTINPSEKK